MAVPVHVLSHIALVKMTHWPSSWHLLIYLGSVTKMCAMLFVIENENSQNLGSSLILMIALAVVMICLCVKRCL